MPDAGWTLNEYQLDEKKHRLPHYSGFSYCRATGSRCTGSALVAHGLWSTGSIVAPRPVGPSWIRDHPTSPCNGRWILSHSTTRKCLVAWFWLWSSVLPLIRFSSHPSLIIWFSSLLINPSHFIFVKHVLFSLPSEVLCHFHLAFVHHIFIQSNFFVASTGDTAGNHSGKGAALLEIRKIASLFLYFLLHCHSAD